MPDDDQRKRMGRPPLDVHDPSKRMCLRLPSKQYDELYAEAQRARLTVPELIRKRLRENDT